MRTVPKSYKPWTPTQSYLLPPSPLEWLPQGHLAYFILDLVGQLDLTAIEGRIAERDPRGERPYAPAMMVALLLYGYSVGVYSSRRIARATYEDVAFRVLSGDTHPYFTTINEFRLEHREALAALFLQVLRLCRQAGLVKLGLLALDGTKIRAAASKHKAMSYKRMLEEEARLKAEVEALLMRADKVNAEEDQRFGVGRDDEDIPAELARREHRLEKIRQAREALEREAAEARAQHLRELAQAQKAKAADESVDVTERRRAASRAGNSLDKARELDARDDDDEPGTGAATTTDMPMNSVPCDPAGKPKPTAQRNFTDPDSRIMVKEGAFVQAYNAQTVVDSEHQVIVAHGLGNQAPDVEYFIPMIERMLENCGHDAAARFVADSGYLSTSNVAHADRRGLDVYIAAGRGKPGDQELSPPMLPVRRRMRSKLATRDGHATYARRKVIAEPPFGQIQEARRFRRFSMRGRAKSACEWAIVCLTHNLLKLFRAITRAAGPLRPPHCALTLPTA